MKFKDFTEKVLAEAPRLSLDDKFTFDCHPGVSCFNACCGDINIFLTPYDVLRLKRRLKISSTEFLSRYTVKPFTKEQKLPVVVLKMHDDKEGKPCQFVGPDGCGVYEDRPWPCRMYPVGTASPREGKDFYFLMEEEGCEGFKEGEIRTVGEWIENQGVGPYNEAGEEFKAINLHPALNKLELNPNQMQMYYVACYDIDRFREFVFDSSFLDKYEVEPETVEAIREDDEALLQFGFRWLRTSLFNEQTVKLREETRAEYEARLAAQGVKRDK
jgi:uncharacterized protein